MSSTFPFRRAHAASFAFVESSAFFANVYGNPNVIASRNGRVFQWPAFAVRRSAVAFCGPFRNGPFCTGVLLWSFHAMGNVAAFPRKSPPPEANVNVTVDPLPVTVRPVTTLGGYFPKLHRTSCAVIGEPSAHVAVRRFMVIVLAATFVVQDDASHGDGRMSVPRRV